MNEKTMNVIFDALAEQIRSLKTEIYILEMRNEDLSKENAELKSQRDALCRKETENA